MTNKQAHKIEIKWLEENAHIDTSNIEKKYCDNVNFLNILQSHCYAITMRITQNLSFRIGLIHINGTPAGYIQILEKKALNSFLHALIIDRGPIWFEGYDTEENFKAFICALKKEFPKRIGRKIRLIPEIEDSLEIRSFLQQQGYKRSTNAAYQTAWIDLSNNQDTLRKNLKKKWRGSLQKAEKNEETIKTIFSHDADDIKELLLLYAKDKAQKQYNGPSVKLLLPMIEVFAKNNQLFIAKAYKSNKLLGFILLLCHGRSATYQIGWNSTAGRSANIHHLLLWQAMLHLKDKGYISLDLGGMNDESASAVKKFKQGLGGREITLPGLYN